MILDRKRIVIAGTGSGCGKTTVTAGILQCLVNRNIKTAAFKCGPDYIDPMFHSRITGMPSGNLDPFFSDADNLRCIMECESEGCDICVAEGVMGYYDGVGYSWESSTYDVARKTETPAILIINCKGMGSSVSAVLEGFINHASSDSCIRGVIFNRMSAKLYSRAAKHAESLGIKPLGYIPASREISLENRHLGLITPGEIHDFDDRISKIASIVEETADIDGIIEIASGAKPVHFYRERPVKSWNVSIAVAKDEAFCFTYRENMEFLKDCGCTIEYFSPLRDQHLPEGVSGMILSGGYPELYAEELSRNMFMLKDIKDAVESGMPVIAECGGFMYLHDGIEDQDGTMHRMAGVFSGKCFRTDRLDTFGYINLRAEKDGLICPKGAEIRAHEFHYWKSSCTGSDFTAAKMDGSKSWQTAVSKENMYAGFPHLFFRQSYEAAERFIEKCDEFRKVK